MFPSNTRDVGIHVRISIVVAWERARHLLRRGRRIHAQIATVLLGIPDPLPLAKRTHSRNDMIRFIRELQWSGLIKTDWNPDEHPR